MQIDQLKPILEAALLASSQPLSPGRLRELFAEQAEVDRDQLDRALEALSADCAGRGIELVQVASGYRYQVRQEIHSWLSPLWREKPARYSRALLETLALIAYRQPITRPEIEQVRGVAVSTSIMKTLEEREWVRVVGHRDVPGRPALYGTTRAFLDHFNLKSLDQLPSLAEIRALQDPAADFDPELLTACVLADRPTDTDAGETADGAISAASHTAAADQAAATASAESAADLPDSQEHSA
ncbi:SMC-Scp complex subunit ScpB [Frateuria aurantia]|uniref:Segregation and condensation protein B n=1 Tax=Frateuria aurantia (strain ATCC 33424 / DSM 6220 / KCTC 2777 / LMG 1558 / NBRC 3245 / NCIMB 13370) TaxID=767434 RepID=H8L6C3_FRAAD|nr:SMC-Scp complex subunit ScpB [Frateuria aurantia]AFC86800.1 segregation and condensation protein B [Frateuria aurantia DSM 6220]